jgi:hypothetical protein
MTNLLTIGESPGVAPFSSLLKHDLQPGPSALSGGSMCSVFSNLEKFYSAHLSWIARILLVVPLFQYSCTPRLRHRMPSRSGS